MSSLLVPGTEIVSGTWPDGAKWRTTYEEDFPLEVQAEPRLCSAAGVVVLCESAWSPLPDVVLTRRDVGRFGRDPEFEIAFGGVEEGESIQQAAVRETLEETGAIVDAITLFAICRIVNATGGKYKDPVSFMAYYYGRAINLGPPREEGHYRRQMPLETMGELARLSPQEAAKSNKYRVNPDDAKIARAAVIACNSSLTDKTIGPL